MRSAAFSHSPTIDLWNTRELIPLKSVFGGDVTDEVLLSMRKIKEDEHNHFLNSAVAYIFDIG